MYISDLHMKQVFITSSNSYYNHIILQYIGLNFSPLPYDVILTKKSNPNVNDWSQIFRLDTNP